MGSGASSKKHRRECPEGYDNYKFKMILQLYDKLDSDGDNVVDISELKNIADLHIKNKITVRTKYTHAPTQFTNVVRTRTIFHFYPLSLFLFNLVHRHQMFHHLFC